MGCGQRKWPAARPLKWLPGAGRWEPDGGRAHVPAEASWVCPLGVAVAGRVGTVGHWTEEGRPLGLWGSGEGAATRRSGCGDVAGCIYLGFPPRLPGAAHASGLRRQDPQRRNPHSGTCPSAVPGRFPASTRGEAPSFPSSTGLAERTTFLYRRWRGSNPGSPRGTGSQSPTSCPGGPWGGSF